ncbi:MAG: cob(I)yrinic acid a,c-diamide adenosyltransferase [Chloroflexi bacterium]|nr:cob(I)yrinic acid a,c-diamide adenosyltransferase [Chloroflexota bacterium]
MQGRHPFQSDPTKPPQLQDPSFFTLGLVHVITGNGKGKTSAAFGLGLRAVGHGLRVFAAQFMKGDERYGEFLSVQFLPNFTLQRFGTGGLVDMHHPSTEDKAEAARGIAAARQAMASRSYEVVILDEINVVVAWKLAPLEDVVSLITEKPTGVELVLTGRYAPLALMERADYVTMLGQKKHPYARGIVARQGIDY